MEYKEFRSVYRPEEKLRSEYVIRDVFVALLWLMAMIFILVPDGAHAQLAGTDQSPGIACAPENAVTMTANPGGDGGYILTCLEGVWVATFEIESPTDSNSAVNKAYADNLALQEDGCENAGPPDCPQVGDTCRDGSLNAGRHPQTGASLFMHPTVYEDIAWSVEEVDTGADDRRDGSVNQSWIVLNKTLANYPSFEKCEDLNTASALGHTDWYLPSLLEMFNLTTFGGTLLPYSGSYNSSSEHGSSSDKNYRFNRGGLAQSEAAWLKTSLRNVVCIRKE